ncbi:hypothetical protein SapgrDRAFT_3391 [Saprospira grandis DSM 2844]|uniref:Uncharacterized protein n=1 Tax=Saprospira grandis DSM 2844 TaxID=694433 RepID=J0Y0H5_9BACT|nr:hypothetical protein [Saprospira grandis]EJF55031.1 hypothetical protein SapgrDRAFT_3391 [Saprospira grandis DSM 2844]
MKNFLIYFIALLFPIYLFGQNERTIIQTFINPTDQLEVKTEYTLEAEAWREDYIRLYTYVKVGEEHGNVLKKLLVLGRYDWQIKGQTLYMPKIDKQILLNNSIVEEEIHIKINYPQNMQLLLPDKGQTAF